MSSDMYRLFVDRRQVLGGMAAGLVAPAVALAEHVSRSRVHPAEAAWPSEAEWASLHETLGGRLLKVTTPSFESDEAADLLSNPFYIRDQVGLTQSSGRVDGWRSSPSVYAVRARNAADVSAAVRFAWRHRLRLVVKGGGHSYLGGSNAPDSLLVWTRDLEEIELHDSFVPQGMQIAGVPAVSVGAGCIWHDVYEAVTTRGNRYVQGGGCTTVGVAGLVQGGGFGSFSKTFGLAAAGLLETEIVTADGHVRIVNANNDPDLFWALKGGGGGTWGVVTRLTLRTHELPSTFGVVQWELQAKSDNAFRLLLDRFVALYAEKLCNPHWGEQASARPGNRLGISMMFQGLSKSEAQSAWQELIDFVAAHPAEYQADAAMLVAALPARRLWNGAFLRDHVPSAIAWDTRPGVSPGQWWWASNGAEAAAFWHGYESAWLPSSLLTQSEREKLTQAWFAASRHWSTTFHFNKGLAGASAEAIAASRNTAMNPQVLDAFALAIIAMDGPTVYRGVSQSELAAARDHRLRIRSAMDELRRVAPGAGSYLSESDYDLANWGAACWGPHVTRLDAIKARYDPDDLFIVHHGVGSQRWSNDGFEVRA